MGSKSASQLISNALLKKESPDFAFVTITNPRDIKDPSKQTTIRRHARTNNSRSKNQRRKQTKIVFDLPVAEEEVEGVEEVLDNNGLDFNDAPYASSGSLTLGYLRPLGSGRGLNPMTSFPVQLNARTIELVDFMHVTNERFYRPMQPFWFTVAMTDKSAFHLTLANAALFLGRETNFKNQETAESMKHYTVAMQSITKRLRDPKDSTSEGVIGTVAGLVCHDHMIGNFSRWSIHMDGLERIVRSRGGLETLKASQILRIMIFWIDVTGSYLLDRAPRFPIPFDLVEEFTYSHQFTILNSTILAWNATFPTLTEVSDLLMSMANVAHFMNENPTNALLWRDDILKGRRLAPIMHQLLSLPRMGANSKRDVQYKPEMVMREAIRLACLVFFAFVKRQFCIHPDGIDHHKNKITTLLIQHPISWFPFLDLRLWVLVIEALAIGSNERAWHVAEILDTTQELGLNSWDEAIEVVKGIFWVDELFSSGANVIGKELEHAMNRCQG